MATQTAGSSKSTEGSRRNSTESGEQASIIDLKRLAYEKEIVIQKHTEVYDEPFQVDDVKILTKIMEDFQEIKQYQNIIFMIRLAIKNQISPPYRVFVNAWPNYEVVNIFRDRNSPKNDDQSTIIYRDFEKMVQMLVHTNLRHVYGRTDRETLFRGIKEEHFADFLRRMPYGQFQLYDFSPPYITMSLLQDLQLMEKRELAKKLYKIIEILPESREFDEICSNHADTPKDQLKDYVKNFPSVAIAGKQSNRMVAYALVTSTGAIDHVHEDRSVQGQGLRENLLQYLVTELKTDAWLDRPFLHVIVGDDESKNFFEGLGFKDTAETRRALKMLRWGRVPPSQLSIENRFV